MDRFHVIDEGCVIIRRKGLFRQVAVFQRGGGLYAKYAGGFVRLYVNGNSGIPDLTWDEIDLNNGREPFSDVHGKLLLERPRMKVGAGYTVGDDAGDA